jgi:hypothetical protein
VEQRKIVPVKDCEELFPGDVLQRVISGVTGKIQAKNVRPRYARGTRPALFRPAPNLLVIIGNPR